MIRTAIVFGIAVALGGCATRIVTKTVPVEIAKYISVPVPRAYTDSIAVIEPPALCKDAGEAVWCNGQIADMLIDYRQALEQCNADRGALRFANPNVGGN